MVEFLQQFGVPEGGLLWGVPAWRLAAAILIIFAGFASRRLIQATFRRLGKRSRGTSVEWDDDATRLLAKPLAVVAQILLWKVAVILMLLPVEPVNTRAIVGQGLDVALVVGLVWVLFRIVDVLAAVADRFADRTETRIDDQAVPLLRKTLKVFLGLLAAIFIIQNLGFSVLSVVTGLGIGGLALALAAQDSVANFFGSFILFTDAPFQVEDYVEVNGVCGVVEEVGFRTTRIRQDDSSVVCVPNQTFTGSFIINHSERKGRFIAFDLGVAYPARSEVLRQFVANVRTMFSKVVNIRESSVEVHVAAFEETHVKVRIRAFTVSTKWDLFLETRQELMLDCLRLLEESGLSPMVPPHRIMVEQANGKTAVGKAAIVAAEDSSVAAGES